MPQVQAQSNSILEPAFIAAFRSGTLTEAQAKAFAAQDSLVIQFQMLQLSAALAEKRPGQGPHAPPSATPLYDKPVSHQRKQKRGAKDGHPGSSRPKPERIDHHETHQLPACPDCGGKLKKTGRTRIRYTEDIPNDLKSEATEHTIHRDWCPCCKKQVEPKVPDALPQCTLGHRAVTLSAWLHYGVGTTTSQVVDVFNQHLQMKITSGGLTQMWHRLANVLQPWYEQIWQECLDSGVLCADETGWSVEGSLWWLWCFCTPNATCYMLDESRGHAALDRFFVQEFEGILVTDFWKAYDVVGQMHQKCWPHLLRELKEVEERHKGVSDDWPEFAKRLRRIYSDAIRLAAARDTMPPAEHDSKVARLHGRMVDLANQSWTHVDAERLSRRLGKYGADLLTFVEFDGVPSSNNQAEREVRPAVLMRKASYGNQSPKGATTRAVLMTIYRTLKIRGLDPLSVTRNALETYTTTGQLPVFPVKSNS